MMYLVAKKELVIWIKVEHLNVLKWNIYASYAIHNDMKGRTRSSLSMVVGNIHAKSIKKIINVKSSTESELLVVDDCLPQILWKTYFLESQG